jgi:hypothetical protein
VNKITPMNKIKKLYSFFAICIATATSVAGSIIIILAYFTPNHELIVPINIIGEAKIELILVIVFALPGVVINFKKSLHALANNL